MTKIKFKSFGKITYHQTATSNKKVQSLMDKKTTLSKFDENSMNRNDHLKIIDRDICEEIEIEEGKAL